MINRPLQGRLILLGGDRFPRVETPGKEDEHPYVRTLKGSTVGRNTMSDEKTQEPVDLLRLTPYHRAV